MNLEIETAIRNATLVSVREGYNSDNALTILSDVFRGRAITKTQRDIALAHQFTEAEVFNIRAALVAAGEVVL